MGEAKMASFDFEEIPEKDRAFVLKQTEEIRDLFKAASLNIIDIGKSLVEVKDRLNHGQFGAWLDTQFGCSHRSAQRFMEVAKTFKYDNLADLQTIDKSALYVISNPQNPPKAVRKLLSAARNGEHVTHAVATRVIADSKPSQTPRQIPPPEPSKAADKAPDAPPFEEFNAKLDSACVLLRQASRILHDALEVEDGSVKCKWGKHLTVQATSGACNAIVRAIQQNKPAKLDDRTENGFLPQRVVDERAKR